MRISTDKKRIIDMFHEEMTVTGTKYSYSDFMALTIKCGLLILEHNLSDKVNVLHELKQENFRLQFKYGFRVDSIRDYDSSLAGIFDGQRTSQKASHAYMFRWTQAALASIGRKIGTEVITYVTELAISAALLSSESISNFKTSRMFLGELARLDDWLADNAKFEIEVAEMIDEMYKVPLNKAVSKAAILKEGAQILMGKVRFPLGEFYDYSAPNSFTRE